MKDLPLYAYTYKRSNNEWVSHYTTYEKCEHCMQTIKRVVFAEGDTQEEAQSELVKKLKAMEKK